MNVYGTTRYALPVVFGGLSDSAQDYIAAEKEVKGAEYKVKETFNSYRYKLLAR